MNCRVLHIGKFYPPHRGGMERHLQVIAEATSDSVDVRVLVSNDDRTTVRDYFNNVSVIRAARWFELGGAPICPSMVREIQRAQPQIVHLHWPNPTAALALLASGFRGPVVVTYHSDVVRQRMLAFFFRPILSYLLRRASAIIVSTQNYLTTSSILKSFRDKCEVIPFGLPQPSCGGDVVRAAEEIRARYQLPLILAVGRFVYYKGFEYLIRAMVHVPGILLLIGDGPLRGEYEKEATALGVCDRVVFVPEVSDLTPYYLAAAVFVLPSVARSEAFGLVQLEAMMARVPVVNTSIDSGVPFVSIDGVSGLTVPPRDERALSVAINGILGDRDLHQRLSEGAARRAREEFSVQRMAGRTVEIYRSVSASQQFARMTPQSIDARST